MKKYACAVAVILALATTIFAAPVSPQDSTKTQKEEIVAPVNEHLEPFLPFIGKTWKGTGAAPDSGQAMSDVSRWERALNGQGIRILHSVNDGEYGGETIIMWDAKKKSLVFFYFTTAGFYTNGTMRIEGNQFVSHEYVTGNENGITEVRSVSTMLSDGRLHSASQYMQNGKWVNGHEFFYQEDPAAKVIFR